MADNLSDKDIVLTPPIRVPVPFSLPPTLDTELFRDRKLEGSGIVTQTAPGAAGQGEFDDARNFDNGLLPPFNARVVQQIIRFGPDGRQVVDVVIEADPAEGAIDYEIRRANV